VTALSNVFALFPPSGEINGNEATATSPEFGSARGTYPICSEPTPAGTLVPLCVDASFRERRSLFLFCGGDHSHLYPLQRPILTTVGMCQFLELPRIGAQGPDCYL